MQEPAPQGIVVVDKENDKIETGIANNVTQAGIKTSKEDVSPDPLHILEGLENMVDIGVEVVGSSTPDFDRIFRGEGPQTGVRTVGGSSWLRSLKEKAGKLRMLQGKKAA